MHNLICDCRAGKGNMENEMFANKLESWKKNLTEELTGIETQLEQLRVTAVEKREKTRCH